MDAEPRSFAVATLLLPIVGAMMTAVARVIVSAQARTRYRKRKQVIHSRSVGHRPVRFSLGELLPERIEGVLAGPLRER